MSVWRRSTILFVYFFLICLASWILEWFLLWETGFATFQIVEPLQDLSVAQLQALLEKRGISDEGLLEKSDIVNSLQQTGPVQYMELLSAFSPSCSKEPIDINTREQYYEQLAEESESVWLLEIIPNNLADPNYQILSNRSSQILHENLEPVGILTGKIHCKSDPWLCEEYGWIHPQLVLIAPKHHRDVKASLFCASEKQLTPKIVFNWLNKEFNILTGRIESLEELEAVALNITASKEMQISQMVFITELLSPPLLLMTLGLRFSSRIKFSIFTVGKSDKEQVLKILKKHNLNGPPSLVFTSPTDVTSYGSKKGEVFSLRSFEAYIKFLQPKVNDVFLVSLLAANLLAFLEILDPRSGFWKHVIRSLCHFPMYNVIIFMLWLAITALIKLAWMTPIIELTFSCVQEFVVFFNSNLFIYYLIIMEYFVGLNICVFGVFGLGMYIWRKYKGCSGENFERNEDDSWYTVFPMDSYIVNVLFRPMASLSRPRPSHDLGLEEGMELLIERLATPDLWLHPVVSTDYIKSLPIWRYDGWGNEDDLKSESETDWDSLSESDSDMILQNHSCCQDESCKLCFLWTTVKETHVCHRCAILKRKLEKQYIAYRNSGENTNYNIIYEKLLRVCDNCLKTRRNNSNTKQLNKRPYSNSFPLLQNIQWSAPPYSIESRVCAICLDRYRWSAVLCGLPCGHTYHHSCIVEWLSKDNHHCPSCRWPSYKCKVTIDSSEN